MPTPAPIIIKKKVNHGGGHGGGWKVAYANFVTAMMALFIVLWLMNSSKQIQAAVGGYFKGPTGNSKMVGSDMQGSEIGQEKHKSAPAGPTEHDDSAPSQPAHSSPVGGPRPKQ
jgi:flagellar motor protein MotB